MTLLCSLNISLNTNDYEVSRLYPQASEVEILKRKDPLTWEDSSMASSEIDQKISKSWESQTQKLFVYRNPKAREYSKSLIIG